MLINKHMLHHFSYKRTYLQLGLVFFLDLIKQFPKCWRVDIFKANTRMRNLMQHDCQDLMKGTKLLAVFVWQNS